MKALIVAAIEKACGLTGHRRGCAIAAWSLALDDRWDTKQWTGPDPSIT